jgi:hypothetical protein
LRRLVETAVVYIQNTVTGEWDTETIRFDVANQINEYNTYHNLLTTLVAYQSRVTSLTSTTAALGVVFVGSAATGLAPAALAAAGTALLTGSTSYYYQIKLIGAVQNMQNFRRTRGLHQA